MASKYTSVVYIQGNSRRRYRGYMSATVSNISATQSRVDWYASVEMYNASQYGVAVTCTVDGTQRGSDEGYLSSSPGTTYKTVASTSGSTTLSRGSSSRSVSVTVLAYGKTVSGYGSAGGSASATVSVTIPSIAYSAPNVPSSCAASRVSDMQAKVTWANGSTSTTRPRSATLVERQTDGGAWSQIASVGASVTNYIDNSLSPNHRYAYRARAKGAGGSSSYATSGHVYTTPAAPASVSVTVATGTTCSVDVDGSNAPWAQSWEVQSQLDGGGWVAVGTYATFPQTVDLGGGTVRVRARAVRGDLASAYVESAAVTTITPPLAPTVSLSPSGVAPTGSVVEVSWVPNHPDGSAQTQAQVEYAVGDGEPVTADVTGAATTYQLPADATTSATTVSVCVRTHGADEEWGAWSQPVALAVAVPPSAHLTSPASDGATVDALPLVVEWEATDATGVASQTLTLYGEDGHALHAAQLGGDARSYPLSAATYRLDNKSSYSLSLLVRGGSTLTATATRDFATDFTPPADPVVAVELDPDTLAQSVTVEYGEEGGAPPTVAVDVVRRTDDGSTWLVQGDVADGETVVDPLPPLVVVYWYDVTATAESGAQATVTVEAQAVAEVGAFNFGAAAGECVLARLDPDWRHDVARSGTLYHFADGGEGGGLPVAYGGQDVDATRSMGFTLLDTGQLRRLQALAREHFVCWYRDPYGGRALCAVDWSFSSGVPYDRLTVSASMTETVFEEAW
ncbi:MAG: fibronectin type III domain-containing protein [Atopobiaceae bacterium]|nr:fibronectin type III domain-containing protein [Atopobiaceae bacterium]